MKRILKTAIPVAMALFLAVPVLFGQDFDFKSLDKLGANAKSSTNVTLDGDLLKMAAMFLGSGGDKDAESVKSLVANLKGVYVRSWDYDKPGQYSEADLAPLRTVLKQPKWKAVVDTREDKESTQIYLLPLPNNKLGGVAMVSTEPTSVTVVYIDGDMNMSDVAKLSGNMGIPDFGHLLDGKTPPKADDNKGKKTGK